MNRALHISILLVFLFSAFTFKGFAQEEYNYTFKVKGASEGTAQLAYYYGNKKYLKDSTTIDKTGTFTFSGQGIPDGGIYLVVLPSKTYFECIINGKEPSFTMKTDKKDYILNMKVENSPENTLFYEYLNYVNPRGVILDSLNRVYREKLDSIPGPDSEEAFWEPLGGYKKYTKKENFEELKAQVRDEIIETDAEIKAYRETFQKENPNTFTATLFKAMQDVVVPEPDPSLPDSSARQQRYAYFKNHYFDNIDFSDDRLLRTPIFESKLDYYFDKVVIQNPDSIIKEADRVIGMAKKNKEVFKYVVIHLASKYEKSQVMCMDRVFHHIVKNYYLTGDMDEWISEKTVEKLDSIYKMNMYNHCGLVAQNLSMKDTTGSTHSLYSIPEKYVLVYFWSATCGHCKKTTPVLHEKYQEMKEDGLSFEVFAVCIDRDLKEMKKYVKDHPYDWLWVSDPKDVNHFRFYYNIYSTPTLYLLDENRKIIAKRMDVDNIRKIIENDSRQKGF